MFRIFFLIFVLIGGAILLRSIFTPDGATDPVDIWTQAEVRAEIDLHPVLWRRHINASCENGVVTLIGSVPIEAERDLAISMAQNVPTVQSVNSELQITSSGGDSTQIDDNNQPMDTDQLIRRQAISQLLHTNDTAGLNPTVSVSHGIVTLSGTVPDDLDRIAAEVAIVGIPGMTRIDDQLSVSDTELPVDPKSILGHFRAEATDEWITNLTNRQIAALPATGANNITASTKDGVVTLQGSIDNQQVSDSLSKGIGKILGVVSVENDLTTAQPANQG